MYSIAGFLDKFDFAVEDKDSVIDFAEAHILEDSGLGLDYWKPEINKSADHLQK